MFQLLRTATLVLFTMTLVTGCIYPFLVTAIAQFAFPFQANGSLIVEGDTTVGSSLIGQFFSKPEYFWGRISATGEVPYNAAASGGSNLGPLNPALKESAERRIGVLAESGDIDKLVPIDLVTSSASGLDPHISPAAAAYQVHRVAGARKLSESEVAALVREHTAGREFGILGEPRVNVLQLNLALDRLQKGQ
ncbi:MAG: potassium-transporting ATPase subunit KdpC [Planctomycetaceae bacterium]|nr:potassium-transporting ATPase subunit KdpC [Planctomycetaceae bacterium]